MLKGLGNNAIANDVTMFLAKVPPFQFLPKSTIKQIVRKISIEFYPKGTEILSQGGAPSNYLYVIQKGGVKIFIRSGNDEAVIDYRSEGDSFGFVSLYSGDRSRTNIVAIEDTICYLIDKSTFFKMHDVHPQFAEFFLKSYLNKYVDKTFEEMYEKEILFRAGGNLPFATYVGDITTKRLVTGGPDTTIRDAAAIMADHKVSSFIVVDNDKRPIGIVTDRDLRQKVVAQGFDSAKSVSEIMSDTLIKIQANDYCFEASLKMIHHGIHHLLVMEGEQLRGVFTYHDLMMLQGISPVSIAREIESRSTINCLVPISTEFSGVIGLHLKDGVKGSHIARIIAELNDRLVSKIIEIAIDEMGAPPVPFTWIVFGSEGRKEQTFKTDQDNAIIFADAETPEKEQAAFDYFNGFAKYINAALVRCGFPECPAGYMASNEKWCQPLRIWKRYFTEWITTSTPDAILQSTILFDFRPLFGDLMLAEQLRDHLMDKLKEERFFLARMAASIVDNRPPLGFFRTFVVEKSGEHKNELNLKISAMSLIVDIVRLSSLEKGVRETSTLERIEALKGHHNVIDEFSHELEQSFEFIILLRLLHQYQQIETGSKLDNFINPNELSTLEKQTLREIFQLITRMQDLIDQRYRLGTVS